MTTNALQDMKAQMNDENPFSEAGFGTRLLKRRVLYIRFLQDSKANQSNQLQVTTTLPKSSSASF